MLLDFNNFDLIQAPLASYSTRAYRKLCIDYGSVYSTSEMVSVEGLLREGKKTLDLIKPVEGENLTVQLFGYEISSFEKATEVLLKNITPKGIDINAACPVSKVLKNKAGCFLMKEPKHLGKIVKSVKNIVKDDIKVSVKIRLGFDTGSINYLDCAREIFENGASSLCMHSRTASALYSGKADHSHSALLKQKFKDNIIYISGDIFSTDDILDIKTNTQCNGVFLARGAIGNPFIFKDDRNVNPKEYIKAFIKQVQYTDYYKDTKISDLRKFTPYFFKHIKGENIKDKKIFLSTTATTKDDYIDTLSDIYNKL